MFVLLRAGFLLLALPLISLASDDSGDAFFESKVRPILVGRCLECHGSTGKPKGGLRLDSRAGLIAGGDSGPAAVAGKPGESLFVEAVHYQDELRMPPKAKLPESEIATLHQWVERGLPWPDTSPVTIQKSTFQITPEQRAFWSFQPLKLGALPGVQDESWPLDPIDDFVLAKLEEARLRPTSQASKAQLLRRVTFDLTGLPPTSGEAQTFMDDVRPDAYARLVDRLLASRAYGERWGRHWLDLVRYADARDARDIGSAADIGEAWRYRDWVVNAFNRDLPYTDFIQQQVAGDLLPGPTSGEINPEAMVATGLLTIGEWGTGDADKEKMLTDIVADQIDVVTRGFLGLTVACARCHDHKFDPIATADYYGLAGIFFSTKILPDPGAKTGGSPMLRTPIATKGEFSAIDAAKARVAGAEAQLKSFQEVATKELADSLLPKTSQLIEAAWRGDDSTDLPGFSVRKWRRALGLGESIKPLSRPVTSLLGRKGVDVWSSTADTPWVGANATETAQSLLTFVLPARSVNVHPGPSHPATIGWKSPISGMLTLTGTISDADPAGGDGVGWSIRLQHGRASRTLAEGTIDNGGSAKIPDTQVDVVSGDEITLAISPRAHHTCDTTTVAWQLRTAETTWDLTSDLVPNILAGNPHGDSASRLGVWTFGESHPVGAGRPLPGHPAWSEWDKALAMNPVKIEAAIAALSEAVSTSPALAIALTSTDGPLRPDPTDEPLVLPEVAKLRAEFDRLKALPIPAIPMALVAQEGGVPKSVYDGFHDTQIQVRGDYRRLGPVVPRHFPQIIASELATIPKGSGRRELADWLSSAANPLTARVLVNRVWAWHFGQGLVRTTSNFGKLGELPSHPELLDSLADRFIKGGWSIKQLHRWILLSRTYQQSTIGVPETVASDPENRLLGRMSRRRLESEAIRDNLLAVSGRLDPTPGGPAFIDFATPRRTLYLRTIRSDRSSFGPLFDSADATAIVDSRVTSTVAPQALFLMNHPFALEQAKAVGKCAQSLGDSTESRIEGLYQILYARRPTAEEVAIGKNLIDHANSPAGSLDSAWEAYAQVLLCTNEFIHID